MPAASSGPLGGSQQQRSLSSRSQTNTTLSSGLLYVKDMLLRQMKKRRPLQSRGNPKSCHLWIDSVGLTPPLFLLRLPRQVSYRPTVTLLQPRRDCGQLPVADVHVRHGTC
ncbi:hypothetical protein MTO96_043616 [Rhipicephalus appendiculatus]